MNEASFDQLLQHIKHDLHDRPASESKYLLSCGIYLGFGESKTRSIITPKRTVIENVKEWEFNLNNAFRLTQHEQFVMGSGDHHEVIQKHLDKLMGLKFVSIKFISKYLDAQINLDDGYQFTTFFRGMDYSLSIIAPGLPDFKIDFNNEEAIRKVTKVSVKVADEEKVQHTIELPSSGITITYLLYSDHGTPSYFIQEEGTYVGFEDCQWRLEKDGEYVLGWADYYSNVCLHHQMEFKEKFLEITGQTIWRIEVLNSMGDAKMYIGDRYVLTVFTSFITSWAVYHNNEQVLYCADPVLQEDEKDINQV